MDFIVCSCCEKHQDNRFLKQQCSDGSMVARQRTLHLVFFMCTEKHTRDWHTPNSL